MKKIALANLPNWIRSAPNLRKVLGVGLVFGFVMITISLALFIWAGTFVFSVAKAEFQSMNLHHSIGKIQTQLHSISTVQWPNCWKNVQQLFSPEVWKSNPISDHVQIVKKFCLGSESSNCKENDCLDLQKIKEQEGLI